ncbi:hypothetical protein Val02_07500 [Virgisporangium aliadipatigenens]|uniref:Uncharacterized protein n=1 Tax=Virgisporangium aliadipatigenens TaxID=741659 RepID=A0A8J3YEW4_9ACTN|nr:hypothetical protein [Virgisporangium aliadipatigenens]GIJ43864.1 hypothetical protein Val02_07500 [Virgisporangium aliadipatigenens]
MRLPWRRRTPAPGEAAATLAAMFAEEARCDGRLVYPEHLDRSRLDFSVSSLLVVDDYLDHLHAHRPPEVISGAFEGDAESSWGRTVIRAGMYVGEVLRWNSRPGYEWLAFDAARARFPDSFRDVEWSLSACAVLATAGGDLLAPVSKVLKFLDNGREDSVYAFAAYICR